MGKAVNITLPFIYPDWAKWIAIDKDGTCHIFKDEPTLNYEAGSWARGKGNIEQILFKFPEPFHYWTDSKRRFYQEENSSLLEISFEEI